MSDMDDYELEVDEEEDGADSPFRNSIHSVSPPITPQSAASSALQLAGSDQGGGGVGPPSINSIATQAAAAVAAAMAAQQLLTSAASICGMDLASLSSFAMLANQHVAAANTLNGNSASSTNTPNGANHYPFSSPPQPQLTPEALIAAALAASSFLTSPNLVPEDLTVNQNSNNNSNNNNNNTNNNHQFHNQFQHHLHQQQQQHTQAVANANGLSNSNSILTDAKVFATQQARSMQTNHTHHDQHLSSSLLVAAAAAQQQQQHQHQQHQQHQNQSTVNNLNNSNPVGPHLKALFAAQQPPPMQNRAHHDQQLPSSLLVAAAAVQQRQQQHHQSQQQNHNNNDSNANNNTTNHHHNHHHRHHHLLGGHHHHSSIQTQQQLLATKGFNPMAVVVGSGQQTEILTPTHLRKAKLMFFYVRYPNSSTLKECFRDVRFNKNNTAQLVKWFSNFREFYYIQMEKFARDSVADERIKCKEEIVINYDHDLINQLNNHYNKNRHIELPEVFRQVVEETMRHFFDAIKNKRDQEQSWKKAIYKLIARLDQEVPEVFKTDAFNEHLE